MEDRICAHSSFSCIHTVTFHPHQPPNQSPVHVPLGSASCVPTQRLANRGTDVHVVLHTLCTSVYFTRFITAPPFWCILLLYETFGALHTFSPLSHVILSSPSFSFRLLSAGMGFPGWLGHDRWWLLLCSSNFGVLVVFVIYYPASLVVHRVSSSVDSLFCFCNHV